MSCSSTLADVGRVSLVDVHGHGPSAATNPGRDLSAALAPTRSSTPSLRCFATNGEMSRYPKQLANAARVIGSEPATLQLRYLQTLTEIAAEKNSTIVFPLPLELLEGFFTRASQNSANGGIYPPLRMGRHMLVDGGIVNPVPISVATGMGADLVIAVNLGRFAREPLTDVEATDEKQDACPRFSKQSPVRWKSCKTALGPS